MASYRTGSIVIATNENCCGTYKRVGKAIAIVTRDNESMTLFRLHYNGQYYIIPSGQLRKATLDEKKYDKKDKSYWNKRGTGINLARIYNVTSPTSCMPY